VPKPGGATPPRHLDRISQLGQLMRKICQVASPVSKMKILQNLIKNLSSHVVRNCFNIRSRERFASSKSAVRLFDKSRCERTRILLAAVLDHHGSDERDARRG
jgi:hypothetical protein